MTEHAGEVLCTEVLPRIRAAIPAAVNCVGCEDADELIQDGTALAAKMMHNAEHAGKKVTRSAASRPGEISAGNVAYCRDCVRAFAALEATSRFLKRPYPVSIQVICGPF